MKSKKSLIMAGVIFLALIVAALPFVSSCGPEAEPQKVLKIGITTPTTGKAAEKGSPMGHANLDAIKYVNEELGGAGGYPIEVVWLDNGYDAAKIVTIVKLTGLGFPDWLALLRQYCTGHRSIFMVRCLTTVMML